MIIFTAFSPSSSLGNRLEWLWRECYLIGGNLGHGIKRKKKAWWWSGVSVNRGDTISRKRLTGRIHFFVRWNTFYIEILLLWYQRRMLLLVTFFFFCSVNSSWIEHLSTDPSFVGSCVRGEKMLNVLLALHDDFLSKEDSFSILFHDHLFSYGSYIRSRESSSLYFHCYISRDYCWCWSSLWVTCVFLMPLSVIVILVV
jgi:hypothetical protein